MTNPALDHRLKNLSDVSSDTVDAVLAHLNGKLAAAKKANEDVRDPNWGDALFGALWETLNDIGMVKNPRPYGIFSFGQAIENVTLALGDAKWDGVHKGAHYYNVGLAHVSAMEADRAFKFFLLADEEDERNKNLAPGDLFRSSKIFARLRQSFFRPWFEATASSFHDTEKFDDRLDRLGRLISALPNRHLLARCHLGVFRACFLWCRRTSGVPSDLVEHLMVVEDLAVLTEAVARMLDDGRTDYQGKATIGTMLGGSRPVGNLGFVLGSAGLDLPDETATKAVLTRAIRGNKEAMARIVQTFRNQSAHAVDIPPWLLDRDVLTDVAQVQLDFIATVAREFERSGRPLAVQSPSSGALPSRLPGDSTIASCASIESALPKDE